jgi:hypothetical protein
MRHRHGQRGLADATLSFGREPSVLPPSNCATSASSNASRPTKWLGMLGTLKNSGQPGCFGA